MSSNFNRNLKGFLAVTVMLAMLFTCVCGAYAQPGGMGGNMGGMGGGMQQNQSNMPNQQNQQPGQDIQETEYSEVTLSGSTPSDGGEIATTGSAITLIFNGSVTYAASKRSAGIYLTSGRKKISVSVTAGSDASVLVVTPQKSLVSGTEYILYVSGVKDSEGLAIEAFKLSFTADDDATEATASSVTLYSGAPADGSTLATTGSSIVLTYTGAINYGSSTTTPAGLKINFSKSSAKADTASAADSDTASVNDSGTSTSSNDNQGAGFGGGMNGGMIGGMNGGMIGGMNGGMNGGMPSGRNSNSSSDKSNSRNGNSKSPAMSVPVTVAFTSPNILVITPKKALAADSTYKLTVSGLTDTYGYEIADVSLTYHTAAAEDSDTTGESDDFSDISEDFWAYDAIMELADLDIVNGYGDNTFKPGKTVSRIEFATMLVKALNLTSSGTAQTFADVDTDSWAYAIVEAAKAYLTGYKSSDGTMYFYGSKEAVREDMAVALVKALGLTVQSNDTALAAAFTDYDDISEALRDYVYTAYVEGIMKGSDGEFNPQGGLTRAEAAVLIQRALQTAEKVVVDDSDTSDKVVVGD